MDADHLNGIILESRCGLHHDLLKIVKSRFNIEEAWLMFGNHNEI